MDQINPLAKHFRTPSVYLSLPSKGRWWPDGALDLPQNGQIAIYPMTAKDEVMIKTPDALMNGESTAHVIASCCPSIKDVWSMPLTDLESILIAIRIASFGEQMTITHKCEKCEDVSDYEISLPVVLDQIKESPHFSDIEHDGLYIKLRPLSFKANNKVSQSQFEQKRILKTIYNPELSDEERQSRYNEQLDSLLELNLDVITAATQSITTSDNVTVTNPEFIKEFYRKSAGEFIRKIKNYLDDVNSKNQVPEFTIRCSNCSHENKAKVNFDYSSFFDPGS